MTGPATRLVNWGAVVVDGQRRLRICVTPDDRSRGGRRQQAFQHADECLTPQPNDLERDVLEVVLEAQDPLFPYAA